MQRVSDLMGSVSWNDINIEAHRVEGQEMRITRSHSHIGLQTYPHATIIDSQSAWTVLPLLPLPPPPRKLRLVLVPVLHEVYETITVGQGPICKAFITGFLSCHVKPGCAIAR